MDDQQDNMNQLIRRAAGRGAPPPEPEPEPEEPRPFPDLGQGARGPVPAPQGDPMNANLRAHLSAHRRRPTPDDYR